MNLKINFYINFELLIIIIDFNGATILFENVFKFIIKFIVNCNKAIIYKEKIIFLLFLLFW